MKICVLTENYGNGYNGAMTSTYKLIDYWIKYGIKVKVLTTNIVGPVNKGVKVIKFHSIFNIIYFLNSNNFMDYIGYSDDHFGFLLHIFHIPYIHTYHGNWPDALFHNTFVGFLKGLILMMLYAITIHWASYVGSVSKHAIQFISKFNNKYKIIRNGVDIKRIKNNSDIIINKDINIIMVGNIDKRKFILLVDVLKRIPTIFLKRIHIYVYGKIYNKDIYSKLISFGVHFEGFHFNIPYINYDMFLSTSKMENLSIAAVEAIDSGIPILTFNVGGMSEIVNDDTGIIVSKYNVRRMSEILINIVRKGIKLHFNNNYIINDFNWKNSAKKYIILFQNIINS